MLLCGLIGRRQDNAQHTARPIRVCHVGALSVAIGRARLMS
jgi:hypothetical protein